MPKQKLVAIDFDGTLVVDAFPGIGEFMPGAREALEELSQNFKITIWTCRSGKYLTEMVEFLDQNKVPYEAVNEQIPGYNDFTNSRKIFAHIYIDDRNFPGGFPGWDKVMKELRRAHLGAKGTDKMAEFKGF